MVLEDEKKKIILERLQRLGRKKFFAVLAISFLFGFCVMLLLSIFGNSDTYTK